MVREGGGGEERDRDRQTDRQKERENNTLLHKNKDLSTSRLFYKSVPDDEHSNTQYVKQEYKEYVNKGEVLLIRVREPKTNKQTTTTTNPQITTTATPLPPPPSPVYHSQCKMSAATFNIVIDSAKKNVGCF